jgi:hypothetical protein
MHGDRGRRPFPLYGWFGLALILLFWALNWGLEGPRTHWGFFPLWLGFSLLMDAWTWKRAGDSLLRRSARRYVGLFLVSAPAWWLFEFFNLRTRNWTYVGRELFSDWEYAFWATLSFSTVMPAVFGAAEWVSTWPGMARFRSGPRLRPDRRFCVGMWLCGVAMMVALWLWPRYAFSLLWGAIYCLLEPINVLWGRPSLLGYTAQGDWRPVIALGLGALLCGFFWELWNWRAYPKWVYNVPFVDRPRIFEMPLLGYLGYPPFAWELFALYHIVAGRVRYLRLAR